VATILVVDDSSDTRVVVRMALEMAGHGVEEAGDGAQALTRLETEPLPDLVLLDIRMPGINGWEVLERIRRNPYLPSVRRIPVVLFSAHVTQDDPRLSQVDNLVVKPFRGSTLVAQVEDALRR